jgi:hypothetical protein
MMTHYGEEESRVGRHVRGMVNGRRVTAVVSRLTGLTPSLIVLQSRTNDLQLCSESSPAVPPLS